MLGLVNVDMLSEALLATHEGQTEIAMIHGADVVINGALRLARYYHVRVYNEAP